MITSEDKAAFFVTMFIMSTSQIFRFMVRIADNFQTNMYVSRHNRDVDFLWWHKSCNILSDVANRAIQRGPGLLEPNEPGDGYIRFHNNITTSFSDRGVGNLTSLAYDCAIRPYVSLLEPNEPGETIYEHLWYPFIAVGLIYALGYILYLRNNPQRIINDIEQPAAAVERRPLPDSASLIDLRVKCNEYNTYEKRINALKQKIIFPEDEELIVIPQEYCCMITKRLMSNPIGLILDLPPDLSAEAVKSIQAYRFEKNDIDLWFKNLYQTHVQNNMQNEFKRLCPVTSYPVLDYIDDNELQVRIEKFVVDLEGKVNQQIIKKKRMQQQLLSSISLFNHPQDAPPRAAVAKNSATGKLKLA